MNVKYGHPLEILRQILKQQNGMLFTSDLAKHDIPRAYLSILVKKGEIVRLSRGVYSAIDAIEDELLALQARYRQTIFSHETALYLHDLTDRTPLFYSITVPSGYKATALKQKGHKIFYVSSKLFEVGLIHTQSPHGNAIKVYDLERTICDLLRSRNRIESHLITEALKRYVNLKTRNIDLLLTYAERFRMQNIVRQYIEILL